MGWGSKSVGSFVKAGLPNITGSFMTSGYDIGGTYTGAFKYLTEHFSGWIYKIDIKGNFRNIRFDASWSNSIYGNSNTVQPPAYIVYYIMKIK